MIETTGSWSRDRDRHSYFLAGDIGTTQNNAGYKYILAAVNELSDAKLDLICADAENGFHILIDSGIFWLTNKHKREHGITMDEALKLQPSEIDGFDELFTKYLKIHDRLGENAWGYIELDQGGANTKRNTRKLLQSKGINPIPVYHPLNDGWDYFDELAETHDRICLGNMVQANAKTRLRILVTLWERHRKYPDLFIHCLGMTPDQTFIGWPIDSSDSSAWLDSIRFGRMYNFGLLSKVGLSGNELLYELGCDSPLEMRVKATEVAASSMDALSRNWKNHVGNLKETLGDWEPYPPRMKGESEPQPARNRT